MKLNKYKLPARIQSVILGLSPPRPKPNMDVFHVTELLMPAYARNLLVNKWDEIVQDYSDWLISVQGDALHEAYKKYLTPLGYDCEISFEMEVDGVKLLGTPDVYSGYFKRPDGVEKSFRPDCGTLIDVKQTSVWSPSYKIEDYTKQTNCYSLDLQKKGKEVSKIVIDVWYRNWQLKQSKWSHDYPKIPYEQIELEIWPIEKTEQFIKDQIHYLIQCKDKCSRKDKWQKYAVMRSTNSKEKQNPDKNFDDKTEAENWIANWTPAASCLKSMPKGKITWRITDTPPLNCLDYCPARSVCEYALNLKGK